MENSIQEAKIGLNSLKSEVIGLFKHPSAKIFALVVKVDNKSETIDSIYITQFGAVQQTFGLPYKTGILHLFPDGKNMNDMLNNPLEWMGFLSKFN